MTSADGRDSAPPVSTNISRMARRFGMTDTGLSATPYGSGHIHDTFRVTAAAGPVRDLLLQRINTRVFARPEQMMENIDRVIRHVSRRAEASSAPEARTPLCPQLLRCDDGAAYARGADGSYWRAYAFIPEARSIDVVTRPEEAYHAALGFGRFLAALADFPPPPLHETIRDFHHTRKRFQALQEAALRDPAGRANAALAELAFARKREGRVDGVLNAAAAGELPERVTHNDTKVNNVLLDPRSGRPLCVVDLDTTMPGRAVHDFGDLVRSAACRSAEDAGRDGAAELDPLLFNAVARGWLDGTREVLTPAERACLVQGSWVIAFEAGVRFLTDYLQGDVYFRIHRPDQNLDRCRRHFQLAASIERQEADLERMLRSIR